MELDLKTKLTLLFIVIVGTGTTWYRAAHKDSEFILTEIPIQQKIAEDIVQPETNEASKVTVHLSGAFLKPGLYSVTPNTTLFTLIREVGVEEHANLDKLNLASTVKDGKKYHLTTVSSKKTADRQHASNQIININLATQKEFETLPGVGPSTAKKIIEYRGEHHRFNAIEDLKKVKGIGEKTFEKLKPFLKT